MVARKLNRLITEHPTLVRSKDGRHTTHHRPVLVIMDRNMDLITPVQHASTYQALIDDVKDFETVRAMHRPDGMTRPECGSAAVTKGGHDDTPPERRS